VTLTAKDVFVEAAARGSDASGSEKERADLLKIVQVFGKELVERIEDGDEPGILVTARVFRAGRSVGVGPVLTLGNRMVVGWMKGILKRPTSEVVPFSSIASADLRKKQVSGWAQPVPCVFVAAEEDWELMCSPDVPSEAPLYELLCASLDGRLTPEQWPADGSAPAVR
jgi:hypothetical protein